MDDVELAAHLQALEERLLQPAVRADRFALEALLAADFCEFGSSGRVFDPQAILTALLVERAPGDSPEVREFAAALLAPGVVLVTYHFVRSPGPSSLRNSIWVSREGRWQMRFHQGTRVPE